MSTRIGVAHNPLHTGARLRDRRLALGLKQAELAARAGISASYLNLIEHNKRRIGGKLLIDLAAALGTEPGVLTDGPEAGLYQALRAAATPQDGEDLQAETDRIDALAARFPGWAAVIAAQNQRIMALEAQTRALGDRLGHDSVLADGIHELLSAVAAIRSTAAILADGDSIDPQWQARFHRNLHEEAERLSGRATALARHFDGEEKAGANLENRPPGEEVERLFERSGHHFPAIEARGAAAIPEVLDATGRFGDGRARALAEAQLQRYAEDAERLPLDDFAKAASATGFAPEPLFAKAAGDAALVLRRLASLPPQTGVPEFGLAICDAAGALLQRRRLAAFSVPRYAPGCPSLPLYRAFGRPLSPETVALNLADGTALNTWSVSQPIGSDADGRAIMEATMLLRVVRPGARAVQWACEICGGELCESKRGTGQRR